MSTGKPAGRAKVELYLDDKLPQGFRRAQAELKAFGTVMNTIGQQMLRMSAVVAIPFAYATNTFMGFSDQMKVVQAVTGAVGTEFDALNDKAKELGASTSFTAKQVAEGMTELGRAGYKTGEILASISSTLDLSRSTATELGEAANIAAAAMRGFNLTANDTTMIADVLAATANNSAQTLTDLGESLKYVAPLAVEAGEDIRDTSAALAVLANNGIKGSMAGTALARAYKNLSTSAVQEQLSGLGVAAADSSSNLRKVAAIISDIGAATKSLGSAQRLSIFETVFGRGQAAALKLANAGSFKQMQKTLEDIGGTAKRTAETMDSELGGSFRKMMSAIEGVQIAIGEALSGTLQSWMESITNAATASIEFIESNKSLINTAAKLALVLGTAGAGFMALSGVVKIATGSLWMAQKAYAGLLAAQTAYTATVSGLAAIKAAVISMTATVKVGIVALQAYHAGMLSMEQISKITPLFTNFKAVLAGLPAVLGQIAIAAGVAIAAFKLGEAIAEWTGLDEKIKDAYFWLFNIKELENKDVTKKMILVHEEKIKLLKEEFSLNLITLKKFKERMNEETGIINKLKNTKPIKLSISVDKKEDKKVKTTIIDNEKIDSREWRNKELQLELIYEGYLLEKEKLDLAREEAIAGAEGQQKIIDLINEEYQLRLDLLNMRTQAAQEEEAARKRLQLEEKQKEIAEINGYQKVTNEGLLLELQYDGYELSRKKLELEKRIALERAKAEGANVDLVEKEYKLRNQILEAENARQEADRIAQNTKESSGTFAATNLNQMLGVSTNTFDRIAKASEETAKNTKALQNISELAFAN